MSPAPANFAPFGGGTRKTTPFPRVPAAERAPPPPKLRVSGQTPLSLTTAGLTPTVQAWVNGTATNYGWFFEPNSSDGWDFQTAEGKQQPALGVEVESAPPVQ